MDRACVAIAVPEPFGGADCGVAAPSRGVRGRVAEDAPETGSD